jgi:glycosyltransferase involved in cell wall biosynthesis
LRILTFLPRLQTGGAELNLVQLGRKLTERGHQIDLIYEHEGNLSEDFQQFCYRLTPGPSALYTSTAMRDVPRILRLAVTSSRHKPDLIYANNFSELIWASGVSILTRAPIVCHLHQFHPFRRASIVALGSRTKRFVAISEYLRGQWAGHGLSAERIEMIPNGVAAEDYPPGSDLQRREARKKLNLPADAYVVLHMGRIVPDKGIELLLEAWASLGLSSDAARLLIVGTPEDPTKEDDYLRGLRAKTPAGCDWLPERRDVTTVLHAADVLALPSVWDEPFGRVIIETMSTGRPVVASAVGGIPEILDGEFARMLFPRGDWRALGELLRSLVNWRQDDPGLAERCTVHTMRKYSLDGVVAQLEDVFEDVVAR